MNGYPSSREGVAFGLLQVILKEDLGARAYNEKMQDPKAYVFGLYRECLDVVEERMRDDAKNGFDKPVAIDLTDDQRSMLGLD